MQLQPVVRVILTAMAAGLGAAAATVDNDTVRIVAAILVPTLAAIGIIPPQVPTRTVVPTNESRDKAGSLVGHPTGRPLDESGQSWVTFLFALAALAIIVFVVVALV